MGNLARQKPWHTGHSGRSDTETNTCFNAKLWLSALACIDTAVDDSDRFQGQSWEIKFLSLELVDNDCNKLYTNSVLLKKQTMEKGDTTGKSKWFTTWPGCCVWHIESSTWEDHKFTASLGNTKTPSQKPANSKRQKKRGKYIK